MMKVNIYKILLFVLVSFIFSCKDFQNEGSTNNIDQLPQSSIKIHNENTNVNSQDDEIVRQKQNFNKNNQEKNSDDLRKKIDNLNSNVRKSSKQKETITAFQRKHADILEPIAQRQGNNVPYRKIDVKKKEIQIRHLLKSTTYTHPNFKFISGHTEKIGAKTLKLEKHFGEGANNDPMISKLDNIKVVVKVVSESEIFRHLLFNSINVGPKIIQWFKIPRSQYKDPKYDWNNHIIDAYVLIMEKLERKINVKTKPQKVIKNLFSSLNKIHKIGHYHEDIVMPNIRGGKFIDFDYALNYLWGESDELDQKKETYVLAMVLLAEKHIKYAKSGDIMWKSYDHIKNIFDKDNVKLDKYDKFLLQIINRIYNKDELNCKKGLFAKDALVLFAQIS